MAINHKVSEKPMEFFTREDIELMAKVGGQPYRASNAEDVRTGEILKRTVYEKTNHWGRLSVLPGWEMEADNRWQNSGSFKEYSWVRLFKTDDSGKMIFFTVGVVGKSRALVYKLHCRYSNVNRKNALSAEQVKRFHDTVESTDAKWNEIRIDDLPNHSWESLATLMKAFITKHSALYDAVIDYVWNGNFPAQLLKNVLIQREVQNREVQINLKRNSQFRPVEVDFEKESALAKALGNAGEQLVLEHEKAALRKAGRDDLAKKVEKVKDGEGYDIRSFNLDDSDKFIEVKTTTGDFYTPFFITAHEVHFMEQNLENYQLYRVFNFDLARNAGEFDTRTGDIRQFFQLTPTVFKAY